MVSLHTRHLGNRPLNWYNSCSSLNKKTCFKHHLPFMFSFITQHIHIQFEMVCALSDTDLIWQMLAMKIEATTAEMLAACQMHIAIAGNMSSMGLATKAISTVQTEVTEEVAITWQPMQQLHKTPHSRERALPSKGLHLPCLPECWSLEEEL